MDSQFFKYKELLSPPIRRAAYSDRTAWLMAVMAQLAYLPFENSPDSLMKALSEADFEFVKPFNSNGTQAFLAKRECDKMAILVFRGTQKEDPKDIVTDLKTNFYQDEKGIKIHDGFYKAFKCVEKDIRSACENLRGFSLYVTGHSLGGALALIATRALNSDNLAACYTFGSPKVGNEEFDDDIKPPIYRIVNAYDIVPFSPPAYFINLLMLIPNKKFQSFVKKFKGYAHHGDMRFLTLCDDGFNNLDIIPNYNDFLRLVGFWRHRKESIAHHALEDYCKKLEYWALKRVNL